MQFKSQKLEIQKHWSARRTPIQKNILNNEMQAVYWIHKMKNYFLDS